MNETTETKLSKLKSETADQAKEMKATILEKANDQIKGAAQTAREQIEQKKDLAVNQVEDLNSALHAAADSVENDQVRHQLNRAADKVDDLTGKLHEADLNDLYRSTEKFAHAQPALFVGISFTLGALVGRFVKSSAETEQLPVASLPDAEPAIF